MSAKQPITCLNRNPHVRRLFEIINQSDLTAKQVAEAVGINGTTLLLWAHSQVSPKINNLEAAFNVVGYTLVARTME